MSMITTTGTGAALGSRRRSKPRPPALRAAALAMSLFAFVVLMPQVAEAHHAPSSASSLATTWGKATVSAKRDGWAVKVAARVYDLRRDGDAVYVKAVVDVSHGFDPDGVVVKNSSGAGTSTYNSIRLRVGDNKGTGQFIRGVRFKLCKADWGPDTCVEKYVAVSQPYAHYSSTSAHRQWGDWYMNGASLNYFTTIRTNRSHRYHYTAFDWSADGCSTPVAGVPVVGDYLKNNPYPGIDFTKACNRHDFGYRNFGKAGGLQMHPTDYRRRAVDIRFYWDMTWICDNEVNVVLRSKCHGWRDVYYQAVRNFGGRPFFGR